MGLTFYGFFTVSSQVWKSLMLVIERPNPGEEICYMFSKSVESYKCLQASNLFAGLEMFPLSRYGLWKFPKKLQFVPFFNPGCDQAP